MGMECNRMGAMRENYHLKEILGQDSLVAWESKTLMPRKHRGDINEIDREKMSGGLVLPFVLLDH